MKTEEKFNHSLYKLIIKAEIKNFTINRIL